MPSARTGLLIAACLTLMLLTPGCVKNMEAFKDALGASDDPVPEPEPQPEPEPEPLPPIAKATADATRVTTGEAILFTATGSSNPEGGALEYIWAFGDGHTGEGDAVTHAYDAAGTYVARLTVTNDAGKTDVDSIPITVRKANEPPVARITVDLAGGFLAGEAVNFTAADSSDPENGDLEYAWDFGDGATSTEESPAHAYERPGRYDVQLTVRDPNGLTANATARLAVDYRENFTGSLSPVGADMLQHVIPVVANATRLNLTLSYGPGYGTNTLRLMVIDGAGDVVANVTGSGVPGDNAQRYLFLEVDADTLAGHPAGDWVARVELTQGLGGDYALAVTEHLT